MAGRVGRRDSDAAEATPESQAQKETFLLVSREPWHGSAQPR